MAAGKRPVPFRTRKLSPPAPMVLPPGGSGRVGYRRPNNFTHKHPLHNTNVVQRVLFHIRSQSPTAGVWRDPPHCGQPQHHLSLAHTHQIRARVRLRIADNRGVTTRRGAYCGAKVEYRTSSTPAYTDGLDLHHSTNNAPTTTQGRSTLRIADNPGYANYWRPPTNSVPGLTPHCGQLRLQQLWVLTQGPCSWRSRKS